MGIFGSYIYVGSIKCVDTSIISVDDNGNQIIEKYWRIATHAALICLAASASLRTQPAQSEVPYDIQPRMTFETFKPELPKRTGRNHLLFRDDDGLGEWLTVGHFLGRVCHGSLEEVWWYSESANPIYNRRNLFWWMRSISHDTTALRIHHYCFDRFWRCRCTPST